LGLAIDTARRAKLMIVIKKDGFGPSVPNVRFALAGDAL
jgi:hypothetical protein